jgi:toxin HigB-1
VVIVSFACRKTERLWLRQSDHGLPPQIERVALRKLAQLDRSRELLDLRLPPSNRLEALKGDRKGQQSIRVNDQWRVCFRWRAGDAYDVQIVDYH